MSYHTLSLIQSINSECQLDSLPMVFTHLIAEAIKLSILPSMTIWYLLIWILTIRRLNVFKLSILSWLTTRSSIYIPDPPSWTHHEVLVFYSRAVSNGKLWMYDSSFERQKFFTDSKFIGIGESARVCEKELIEKKYRWHRKWHQG